METQQVRLALLHPVLLRQAILLLSRWARWSASLCPQLTSPLRPPTRLTTLRVVPLRPRSTPVPLPTVRNTRKRRPPTTPRKSLPAGTRKRRASISSIPSNQPACNHSERPPSGGLSVFRSLRSQCYPQSLDTSQDASRTAESLRSYSD